MKIRRNQWQSELQKNKIKVNNKQKGLVLGNYYFIQKICAISVNSDSSASVDYSCSQNVNIATPVLNDWIKSEKFLRDWMRRSFILICGEFLLIHHSFMLYEIMQIMGLNYFLLCLVLREPFHCGLMYLLNAPLKHVFTTL